MPHEYPRDKMVLELKAQGWNVHDISKKLRVSRERTRQIIAIAEHKRKLATRTGKEASNGLH